MNTTEHTQQILTRLRAEHGDTIAQNWEPMVAFAITALHNGDELNQPVVIAGKKFSCAGQVVTSLGVLDTIADMLGVNAISQDSWFNNF
jgi:hypothetical protein